MRWSHRFIITQESIIINGTASAVRHNILCTRLYTDANGVAVAHALLNVSRSSELAREFLERSVQMDSGDGKDMEMTDCAPRARRRLCVRAQVSWTPEPRHDGGVLVCSSCTGVRLGALPAVGLAKYQYATAGAQLVAA